MLKYEQDISDPMVEENPLSVEFEDFGKEIMDIMDSNIVLRSENPMEPTFEQEVSSDNKSLTEESQTGNTTQSCPDGLGFSFEDFELKHSIKHVQVSTDPQNVSYAEQKENKPKRKRKAHPTKNFLVNFRKSHLNAIYSVYGEGYEHELLEKIKNKPGMNMKDYEELYNETKSIFSN